MSKKANDWTGERLETHIMEENTNEHLHRYCIAADWVKGLQVLDIACGEGYGTDLLARTAAGVTGVDISEPTILAAREKYKRHNVRFLPGEAHQIPCDSHSFDVVVSFETIEHHDRHDEMMGEIKRVLKPEGVLIISSPDKRNYSEKPGYHNPFHVKELYRDEFESLIKRYFKEAQFLKQKHVTGSLVLPLGIQNVNEYTKLYSGSYSQIMETELEALYLIAIASDLPIKPVNVSFFDGTLVLKSQFREMEDFINFQVTEKVAHAVMDSEEYKLGQSILRKLDKIKKFFNA